MAKTKASVAAKVSSGKSSKAQCSTAGTSSGSSKTGRISHRRISIGPGNRVCKRNIPEWQKPITHFFSVRNKDTKESDDSAGTAKISNPDSMEQSFIKSSEDDTTPGKKANNAIQSDNTYSKILNPINKEDTDRINNKSAKGKGKGKKSNPNPSALPEKEGDIQNKGYFGFFIKSPIHTSNNSFENLGIEEISNQEKGNDVEMREVKHENDIAMVRDDESKEKISELSNGSDGQNTNKDNE